MTKVPKLDHTYELSLKQVASHWSYPLRGLHLKRDGNFFHCFTQRWNSYIELVETCDYQCLLLYRLLRSMWTVLRVDRKCHLAKLEQNGLSWGSHHNTRMQWPSRVLRNLRTISTLNLTPSHIILHKVSSWVGTNHLCIVNCLVTSPFSHHFQWFGKSNPLLCILDIHMTSSLCSMVCFFV